MRSSMWASLAAGIESAARERRRGGARPGPRRATRADTGPGDSARDRHYGTRAANGGPDLADPEATTRINLQRRDDIMPTAQLSPAQLVAELNDLLQLDHDAVQSYSLAIPALENVGRRQTLIRFREDHERHIAELTALIRANDGLPIELPHPTGPAKLAAQALGDAGGDREVLIAFKANERQSRDKYAKAVERLADADESVLDVVRRGASDEARHYAWAEQTLESLGVSADRPLGRAALVMEKVHARTAEGIETVGRQGMRGFEAARRAVKRPGVGKALVAAVAVAGVGLAIAGLTSG